MPCTAIGCCIERDGGLETLTLPRNPMKGGALTRAPAAGPTRRTDRSEDPTLLAGLVRVQPVFNQGKLGGYRIFPGGTARHQCLQPARTRARRPDLADQWHRAG